MIRIDPLAPTVRTISEWQASARRLGVRTWQGAMRRTALANGEAIAMLSDDGAILMERDHQSPTGTDTRVLPASEIQWVRA